MFLNRVLALVTLLTLSILTFFVEGNENERVALDPSLDRELAPKSFKAPKSSKAPKSFKAPKSSKQDLAPKSPKQESAPKSSKHDPKRPDKKTSKKKKPKASSPSKTPKSSKSPKGNHNEGKLKKTIDDAIIIKGELHKKFNFDTDAKEQCIAQTDDHQHCVYDAFKAGDTFMCECRPTSGAQVFQAVDYNNDDYITLEEILAYFDAKECVFPFKYETDGVMNTYNSCTSDDDTFGLEWCSIRTLQNGVHAKGFFKYCDLSSNILAWEDALQRLDTDEDGRLSFDEALANARRRRLQLTEYNCNDCTVSEDCSNVVISAIDGECRNAIKTEPLGDDELLHMLGFAMQDVYCNPERLNGPNPWTYEDCPTIREGMDEWIVRDHLEVYPERDNAFLVVLCAAIASNSLTSAVVTMVGGVLEDVLGSFNPLDVVQSCEDVLAEASDGRDALQWATYIIQQGPHEGKKILAFMGTDFSNAEQLLADIWSTPTANYLIRNMAEEAVQVAIEQDPDFITGHSLGGILTEMVCSERGIEGASFAALGAYDPFTRLDAFSINVASNVVDTALSQYSTALETFGFDNTEIEEMIANWDEEDIRQLLIRTEYNGLIENTLHNGVKFDVVVNTYDLAARPIGSIDGSACSHIAKSCDVRWTYFSVEHTFGHSSAHYTYNVNSYYTIGWENWLLNARVDYNKIFLPDVQKNIVCDFCNRDEYCESDSCFDVPGLLSTGGQCKAVDGRMPTWCPDESSQSGERGMCESGSDCQSGRCEYHVEFSFSPLSTRCYDKLPDGSLCNENSDCISGSCSWFFYCN